MADPEGTELSLLDLIFPADPRVDTTRDEVDERIEWFNTALSILHLPEAAHDD